MSKVENIHDYTARKREDTTKGLMRCPKCGKIGMKKLYNNGDAMFLHKEHQVKVAWIVDDYCFIAKK